MLRTGMNPSNWVAWTILPRRSASLAMGDLHDLHEDRPDLAYSAFQGFGGAAILPGPAATPGAHLYPPRRLSGWSGQREKSVGCLGTEEEVLRCGSWVWSFQRVRPSEFRKGNARYYKGNTLKPVPGSPKTVFFYLFRPEPVPCCKTVLIYTLISATMIFSRINTSN